MAYDGYHVLIGGVKLPRPDGMNTDIVVSDSIKIHRNSRIAEKWPDQNGIDHVIPYQSKKAFISFTIRERTLEEHLQIVHILEETENVQVTYYADNLGVYLPGKFRMPAAPEVVTRYSSEEGEVYYAETTVSLEEY